MQTYTFYQLDKKIAKEVTLPDIPFPVRTEKKKTIFGKSHIDLALLIDECAEFLADHPEYMKTYQPVLAHLAYQAGIALGTKGQDEEAEVLFAKGLDYDPNSIAMRAAHAHALTVLERNDEAIQEYKKIIKNPEKTCIPLIWILAARLFAQNENYKEAYKALETCSEYVQHTDTAFWEFHDTMADKAGFKDVPKMQKPERVQESKPIKETPVPQNPQKKFCGSCGKTLKEGAKFCGGCGRTL